MSDYNEEVRNNRKFLTEAKWFKDTETMTKQWFGLNKPRPVSTTIKSLFNGTGEEETKDPVEMLGIARTYHAELQSEPPMDEDREKAITEILDKVKIKLNEEERRDIEKSITYKEVYDTLKKAPNGKAPGPDGIPIEFWKSEIK